MMVLPTFAGVNVPQGVTLHADAIAWRDRAIAAGGTLTTDQISAVNTFVNALESAGIRSTLSSGFLMPFVGSDLAAALEPLYGTRPTNNNFGSNDWNNAIGLDPGATNNSTSNKYLLTDVSSNLSLTNTLITAYGKPLRQQSQTECLIGIYDGNVTQQGLYTSVNQFLGRVGQGSSNNATWSHGGATGGCLMALSSAANSLTLYHNATSRATNTNTRTIASTLSHKFTVFTRNEGTSRANYSAAAINFAAITAAIDSSKITDFYNAIVALNTTFGRN